MNYRHLGKAGIKVSELSLGAWVTYGGQVGEEVAEQCMRAAYEAGVNFFDNAEAYARGNAEIVMGNVIKKAGWFWFNDFKINSNFSAWVGCPGCAGII